MKTNKEEQQHDDEGSNTKWVRFPGTSTCIVDRALDELGVYRFPTKDACLQSIRPGFLEHMDPGVTVPPPQHHPSTATAVPGVILIISSYVHTFDRVPLLNIGGSFEGWPVVVVLGNPRMKEAYTFDGRTLVVCAEDSYMHLMKKLVVALRAVLLIYRPLRGVLRCGDDLWFNHHALRYVLEHVRARGEYVGKRLTPRSERPSDDQPSTLSTVYHMHHYYLKHTEALHDPTHGLENVGLYGIEMTSVVPQVPYAAGTIFFLSTRACEILAGHMADRRDNIWQAEHTPTTDRLCFPYTVEDIGVGYIMHVHGVALVEMPEMFAHDEDNPQPNGGVAIHTNLNR